MVVAEQLPSLSGRADFPSATISHRLQNIGTRRLDRRRVVCCMADRQKSHVDRLHESDLVVPESRGTYLRLYRMNPCREYRLCHGGTVGSQHSAQLPSCLGRSSGALAREFLLPRVP